MLKVSLNSLMRSLITQMAYNQRMGTFIEQKYGLLSNKIVIWNTDTVFLWRKAKNIASPLIVTYLPKM